MNKKDYIAQTFRKILNEDLQEKADSLMNKLNLKKQTHLYPKNEFDYLQEGKSMCEQCGGMMTEGECSECGYSNEGAEIMELGGMDDGHPRFGNKNFAKLSRKEKEDLMSDRSYEYSDDEEDFIDDDNSDIKKFHGKNKRRNDKEEIDFELELDESWYSHDEYERMRNFGTEDELQAYQDKLVSGVENNKKGNDNKEVEFELELDDDDLGIPDDMPSYKTKYRYSDDEEITEKLHGKQHRLDKNKNGRLDREDFKMLRKQQDEEQLYEVEFQKEVEKGETDESREFAYAAMMAKKKGKDTFELDGETFDVKESILYTETDLIDLIESLVVEEKNSFKMKEPKGYREYERAHKADKKENEDYLKSVAKKMTDYLKDMSSDKDSKYEMKGTQKFPTENGGLDAKRKKYTPSEAVDEYIEAFSYPGQTNLVYDEIKPNEEMIEKQIKGHSTNGNAQVDKDGNALGNVVPSKTGERFFKNFQENLYGQEQQQASYKRQPQPVDQAGETTERGSLKSKRGKKTSQSVLNKIEESTNLKKQNQLNEEFDRMQQLMGYSRKTQ